MQLAPPPTSLARVWFLRQFEPSEALSTPMMYVNGAPMTPSMPGTIFYRDFAPGTYTFTVDSCGSDTNQFPTVQLGPGAQYEFEVQSLESFRPPDCPRGTGVFYVRPVQPRFCSYTCRSSPISARADRCPWRGTALTAAAPASS